MQARHSSSGAVNDVSGMIRTIIPHSLVKAILASHNETKSNPLAQVWPPLLRVSKEQSLHGLRSRVSQALVLRCCQ